MIDEPWIRCPSTHCNRAGECRSPGECILKDHQIRVPGELYRMRYSPGDRFVLRVQGSINVHQAELIQRAWRQFMPESNGLFILTEGSELIILEPKS